MRSLLLVLALASASLTADAAPRRTVRPGNELRLVFLDAVQQGAFGDAAVDVGRMASRCSAAGCARAVVQKRFRLRVEGTTTSRFVRVSAYLQVAAPGQRIKLDGRVLTTSPLLVDAVMPLRATVTHTLEIEVLASEPPGVLAETIVWHVEDAR